MKDAQERFESGRNLIIDATINWINLCKENDPGGEAKGWEEALEVMDETLQEYL